MSDRVALEVKGVTKYFGGLCAISRLDFGVARGEIVGIIGPNGSGKTTLFNMITGVHQPDEGDIRFEGASIAGEKPYEVVRRGIARTSQLTKLFGRVPALGNVLMGLHCRTRAGVWGALVRGAETKAEEKKSRAKAAEILEFLGLTHVQDRPAELLSAAEQRRLMIGNALATQPRLLLLDEPTAGMSAEETAEVVRLIRKVRGDGVTILLIEHNMKVAMGLCDRIVAIESGTKIAEGTPDVVAGDQAVIEAYLGKD